MGESKRFNRLLAKVNENYGEALQRLAGLPPEEKIMDGDTLAKIREKMDAIRKQLEEDSPECFVEQAHTDGHGIAKTYWHYGYLIALKDVLQLFRN